MKVAAASKPSLFPLGPFEIDHPFFLAPMAGITNSPFRRLMRRSKSALVVSELVSANGLQFGSQRTKELLNFEEEERLVGLQIFGEEAKPLSEACQYIEAQGADFVDLNLGCPVNKIVKKGAGSALCREPSKLFQILKAMVESVQIPVTIKIRTGWNDLEKNAHDVIRVAAEAGVSWVAVHGRTRAQGYSGKADWDFIGELKAKSQIPVIGNGDVITPEQAVERFQTYGVDAVMIGRAALRNPFIFRQSAELLLEGSYPSPSFSEYLDLLREQKSLLESCGTEHSRCLQSKKFLAWYSAGYRDSSQFRSRLFRIKTFEDVWKEAFDFYERVVEERDMSVLREDFLMGGHG